MIDETVQLEDDEELEEEAEAEVDKVLFELTDGKLGQAGSVRTELPVRIYLLKFFFAQSYLCFRPCRTMLRMKRNGGRWSNIESSSMDCLVVDCYFYLASLYIPVLHAITEHGQLSNTCASYNLIISCKF